MRKILSTFLFLVSLTCSAQIFNHKQILDKFDDVIYNGAQKTLIQKNDTAFIIEEKGRKPVVYMIEHQLEAATLGDKDNIVNLINDIYGYQECWSVILESQYADYLKDRFAYLIELDEEKQKKMIDEAVEKYSYFLIHRVVTSRYAHQFLNEFFWIQKGDHNGRTVYSNE